MNQLTIDGHLVNIGPTPEIIRRAGFQGPAEVHRAASRCSQGEPSMQMSDVAEYFEDRYPQHQIDVECCY